MSEGNSYDRMDLVRQETLMRAASIKFAAYRVRDPETQEFGKLQFHLTFGDTVMAVMGEEAAKLFCRLVSSTLEGSFPVDVKEPKAS